MIFGTSGPDGFPDTQSRLKWALRVPNTSRSALFGAAGHLGLDRWLAGAIMAVKMVGNTLILQALLPCPPAGKSAGPCRPLKRADHEPSVVTRTGHHTESPEIA
jgi:hypothetical protein